MDERSQGEQIKSKVQSAAQNIGDATDEFRNRMSDAWEASKDKVSECAQATDRAIRDKPYHSVGIALGLGVLIGLLLHRRSRDD